ncbi:hypothetical protein L1987_01339 [Smallanthus sonchifolius]|uniref:Uncharacterized protein n=1 Tax=Smallanthus sonchifolius TaxID=185202 RepID=A0ACB9K4U0_9ASTR|nr:hypothetical protein L1987_01339 [Smallanthus sonchifolius]
MAAIVVAELDETKIVSSSTIDPLGDNVIHPIGGEKKETKKPRKWRWKLQGFIHHRSKEDDEDRCSTVSGVRRSYSESWQDCNNEVNSGFNRKVLRSNNSVSWRSSSLRKSNPNTINSKFGNNRRRVCS